MPASKEGRSIEPSWGPGGRPMPSTQLEGINLDGRGPTGHVLNAEPRGDEGSGVSQDAGRKRAI
jgi:hypothetical protein